MTSPDDYELTEINETLKVVKGINEVYAGELMLYHAITKQTAALYQIVNAMERLESTMSNIEIGLRTPGGESK